MSDYTEDLTLRYNTVHVFNALSRLQNTMMGMEVHAVRNNFNKTDERMNITVRVRCFCDSKTLAAKWKLVVLYILCARVIKAPFVMSIFLVSTVTEPVALFFINDSPTVSGNSISADIQIIGTPQTVLCALTNLPYQDCEFVLHTLHVPSLSMNHALYCPDLC